MNECRESQNYRYFEEGCEKLKFYPEEGWKRFPTFQLCNIQHSSFSLFCMKISFVLKAASSISLSTFRVLFEQGRKVSSSKPILTLVRKITGSKKMLHDCSGIARVHHLPRHQVGIQDFCKRDSTNSTTTVIRIAPAQLNTVPRPVLTSAWIGYAHRNNRHRMRAPISCQSKYCRHKRRIYKGKINSSQDILCKSKRSFGSITKNLFSFSTTLYFFANKITGLLKLYPKLCTYR